MVVFNSYATDSSNEVHRNSLVANIYKLKPNGIPLVFNTFLFIIIMIYVVAVHNTNILLATLFLSIRLLLQLLMLYIALIFNVTKNLMTD